MKATHATAIIALFIMFSASSVPATTATVNYNDLWWDPNESGWGVNGTISQSGTQFQYQETENGENSCTWTGTWTQQGVLGRVDGTVSCIDGMNGTFAMSEVASSWLSVSGRVSANVMINRPSMASCTMAGTFVLLR